MQFFPMSGAFIRLPKVNKISFCTAPSTTTNGNGIKLNPGFLQPTTGR